MKVIAVLALWGTLFYQGYSSKTFSALTEHVWLHVHVTVSISVYSVASQTPWTHVRAGVVMELTISSPVSVTHPVSVTKTVVLTMKNNVKVSDTLIIHQFVLCPLSSVFVFPPSWSHIL